MREVWVKQMCSHLLTDRVTRKGLRSGGYIQAGVFEEQKRERKRAIDDNTLCDCQKMSQCVQGARLWSFALAAVLWPAFT